MFRPFALGLAFLAMEGYEFHHLFGEGAGPSRSAFLSAFFALVATHGLHVTFGLIWTALAGGAFCLLLMTARQYFPLLVPSVSQGWVATLMQPKGDIPYGVAIAIGALMAYPASGLVAGFASGL